MYAVGMLYFCHMKINSTTTYTLDFPMKDGKKVHTFTIKAIDPIEAEVILLAELLECCRQLEAEKREREKKAEKLKNPNDN